MVTFGILIVKIWLLSMIALTIITGVFYWYGRPVRGISVEPELRAHTKLFNKISNVILYIFTGTSLLLLLLSLSESFTSRKTRPIPEQRANFFMNPSKE